MRLIKVLLTTAAVVLVAGVVLGVPILYSLGRPRMRAVSIEKIQAREGIPVEVVRPVAMEFTDYFYCDGEVVADVRAMLRAKVDEVVEAVHARVGEPVHKGQVLVEFRTTDLEAAIQAAETAFEEAQSNYKRYASLLDQRVISEDRLEQARTQRDNAAAALRAARSRLTFAEVASPVDGIVEERWVEPGEYKGLGKELISIVDLSTVEVAALVPEQEVAGLSVGTAGEFQLESTDEWLKGRVSRISPSTQDPNRFFDVFLKVENRQTNAGWLMRPGMYAEVRFPREEARRAPAIPDHCVVFEGDSKVVYLIRADTQQVPVENPGSAEKAPAEVGFVGRLELGLQRVGGFGAAMLRKLRKQEEAQQQPEYRDVEVQVARRLVVREGLRQEGFVQLVDDPVSEDDLVIVRPREAIRDGLKVQIVNDGSAG